METRKKDIDVGLEMLENLKQVSKESWDKALQDVEQEQLEEYEEVELQDEDIDTYTTTDVHVNCPKCGKVYDEYNIVYETNYKCICENCGYKFSFYYCPY